MDRLHRQLAPVSDEAWKLIDDEAARSLRHFLTGRALVDFTGPKGWEHAAESDGRLEPTIAPGSGSPVSGVQVRSRVVRPLQEARAPFRLERGELERVDRGSSSPDLEAVTVAARDAAGVENRLVLDAIAEASLHQAVEISNNYGDYPRQVAQASAILRRAGVERPYGIALGDRCYTGVIETTEHGGYPVLEHVKLILGGPVVWAPDVDGALVVSVRGGDYELVTGGDFAVGYSNHDETSVELYLEESFVFLVHEEKAAVPLRYTGAAAGSRRIRGRR